MKQRLNAYAQLMRLDKPVGFFLLLWPTLWGLWIASDGIVSIKLLSIFVFGVFIMRSAGCVINDFADRRFDPFVRRTANRPLAKGSITPWEALLLLGILLLIALGLVLYLNPLCFWLACLGVLITGIYPFTKRWLSSPQCVLGVAFSLGIPMTFAAVQGTLLHIPWILWAIGIFWPIVYDTLYAMADREDDEKIGVRSTAILLGQWDIGVVVLLEVFWFILWVILAQQLHFHFYFYGFLAVAAVLCGYQYYWFKDRSPEGCFRAFLNHAWVGFVLFLGLLMGI